MEDDQNKYRRRKKMNEEYEFCKVCKLNHNQGLRHKYYPNHKKALSTFLSRFQTKLSDIRFFLNNPTPLLPDRASRNRLWCVFCDTDILELDSSFACCNAINHLANEVHLKNLKHFFWKYGVSLDRLDSFRIVDAHVDKWEKKCAAIKNGASLSIEKFHCHVFGASNDIHNQPNYGNIDNSDTSYVQSFNTISNGVLPLRNYTTESQVSHSACPEVGNASVCTTDVATSLHSQSSATSNGCLKDFKVDRSSNSILHNIRQQYANGCFGNRGVSDSRITVRGDSSTHGLHSLTQISCLQTENTGGNVHSGAPPPWLTEGAKLDTQLVVSSPSSQLRKSKKLNPKRVGAAWAERRKLELEMEKRGEIVKDKFDANWLPNFGRVWQSGSRKESRKEFEMEKQKSSKVDAETMVKIQPYVSKRMQRTNVDWNNVSG